MFNGYSSNAPDSISFDEEFFIEDWPDKMPDDVCSAYIGIQGADFSEAVTVTVTREQGNMFIRDIEWGRP